MKIWYGHGSEHSMNLALIGRFENVTSATSAIERIEALRKLAQSDVPDASWNPREERITDRFREAMWDMGIYDMSYDQVQDFAFDHRAEQVGNELRIWTDESEIQGFIKVLLHHEAKIEIFSLHQWHEDGTPRLDGTSES